MQMQSLHHTAKQTAVPVSLRYRLPDRPLIDLSLTGGFPLYLT